MQLLNEEKYPFLSTLLRSPSTVLSFKEVNLMATGSTRSAVARLLHYYVEKGELYPLRRGLYAKSKKYNRLELGTKIMPPAYVSFETVLLGAGVIFQHYTTIFLASYQTREIECDGQRYSYRRIKPALRFDIRGLENRGTYWVATPERAYLDMLYIYKSYYFDNLGSLNYEKVQELLPLYSNKRMEQLVKRQFDGFNASL